MYTLSYVCSYTLLSTASALAQLHFTSTTCVWQRLVPAVRSPLVGPACNNANGGFWAGSDHGDQKIQG